MKATACSASHGPAGPVDRDDLLAIDPVGRDRHHEEVADRPATPALLLPGSSGPDIGAAKEPLDGSSVFQYDQPVAWGTLCLGARREFVPDRLKDRVGSLLAAGPVAGIRQDPVVKSLFSAIRPGHLLGLVIQDVQRQQRRIESPRGSPPPTRASTRSGAYRELSRSQGAPESGMSNSKSD